LATFKDGFIVGILGAIALQLGIFTIQALQQIVAIYLLLGLSIIVTFARMWKRRSIFSPPVDGFILGFGWLFSLINFKYWIPIR